MMGVTKLWDLLRDCQSRPLPVSSLLDKTLAVDCSQWICELNKIEKKQNVPNLYLRNLFFRTTYLMQHGIKLVFALDGRAPEIKRDAMEGRNISKSANLDRIGMKNTNQKCKELLSLLGLPCLQSEGEAEKLCAQLNKAGKVDGVYTADGDAFLYGAKKVYRNLDKKVDSINCYCMEDIKGKLSLERNGLITIALLSGCDYGKEGVKNVGIKKAYEFIQHCNQLHVDPLNRINEWRCNGDLEKLQKFKDSPQKKGPHCSECRHLGSKKEHFMNGCRPCKTEQSCDPSSHVTCSCDNCCVKHNEFELSMREKALKNPNFPDQEVIQEFQEDFTSLPNITWKPVDVMGLKSFMKGNLNWNDSEFFNKITAILVNLHIKGMEFAVPHKIQPEKIVRRTKQTPAGVIVQWKKLDIDNVTDGHHEVTVPVSCFIKHYPQMLAEFDKNKEEMKLPKKKQQQAGRKRKAEKSNDQTNKITDMFRIVKKPKRSPSPVDKA